jgi:hypothetical protein
MVTDAERSLTGLLCTVRYVFFQQCPGALPANEVNRQGALKQEGVRQTSEKQGLAVQTAKYSTGLDQCMEVARLQNVHLASLF